MFFLIPQLCETPNVTLITPPEPNGIMFDQAYIVYVKSQLSYIIVNLVTFETHEKYILLMNLLKNDFQWIGSHIQVVRIILKFLKFVITYSIFNKLTFYLCL